MTKRSADETTEKPEFDVRATLEAIAADPTVVAATRVDACRQLLQLDAQEEFDAQFAPFGSTPKRRRRK
jgi:hypothetical protein